MIKLKQKIKNKIRLLFLLPLEGCMKKLLKQYKNKFEVSLKTQFESSLKTLENSLKTREDSLKTQIESCSGNVIKNQILSRWQVVDAMDRIRFHDDYEVKCGICEYSNKKNTFHTKISHCIFNGGYLERFVCPECGAIFGPLKMMCMNEAQLEEEYKLSYSVFSDGDSTDSELRTFYSIANDKNGVYLNFGGGAWSNTTDLLRREGYNVYNYEPCAPVADSKWLITDKNVLKNMQFDGLFSNDLIEHLSCPIETLVFMKSLLRDKNSLMAHSTGCYQYVYEYTRFHLYFFTGNSLEYICNRVKLDYEIQAIPEEKPHYINCIYRIKH